MIGHAVVLSVNEAEARGKRKLVRPLSLEPVAKIRRVPPVVVPRSDGILGLPFGMSLHTQG